MERIFLTFTVPDETAAQYVVFGSFPFSFPPPPPFFVVSHTQYPYCNFPQPRVLAVASRSRRVLPQIKFGSLPALTHSRPFQVYINFFISSNPHPLASIPVLMKQPFVFRQHMFTPRPYGSPGFHITYRFILLFFLLLALFYTFLFFSPYFPP